MKLFGLITLIIFVLAGCNKTPEPSDSIVKVIDVCGSNDITVTDIKGRKKPDGFMQAQIVGENSSSTHQKLEYRVVWLDSEGFAIDTLLSKYNSVPAYPNQPFYINATSPSAKAKTFRLYIKRDKEVICDKQYDGQ